MVLTDYRQVPHPGHLVTLERRNQSHPPEYRASCNVCGPISLWTTSEGQAHNAGRPHIDGVRCCEGGSRR